MKKVKNFPPLKGDFSIIVEIIIEKTKKLSVVLWDIPVYTWSIWEVFMLTWGQFYPGESYLQKMNYNLWLATNVEHKQCAVIFCLFSLVWIINSVFRRY